MGLPARVPLIRRLPVLIVGGGLSGFTSALSLHRAGIRNNIITRETKFTQHARSGVFLGGSSIRILDRLGLGPQYRSLGTPLYRAVIEDVNGKEIISFRLDDYGMEVWNVPRQNLQQLLLESIPPDSVHFGTKFRALHISDGSAHVKVQQALDRSGQLIEPKAAYFESKFVVGADGNNSAVRSFMSRPAMTFYSGTSIWRAVVQNQDTEKYPLHIGKEVWGLKKRFGFARMSPDEVVWWAVLTDLPEVLLRPFAPHLLREFSDFPEITKDLILSIESDRSIYRTEMKRVWPEQFPWVDPSSSRIALVGDAGRPEHFGNLHSGHSFAVEDGYFLAHHLAEQNEKGMLRTGPKLGRYQESRQEQMIATKQYSARLDRLSLPQSRIQRYCVRKLLHISFERMALHGTGPRIPMFQA
ncbi:unnamed protein product [Chondrus crispus]|uniref:FAD-binding domain-containing protein n=1 Tax=Chondrus crispus TaxID=2769 RepID=R7Q4U1_CHOCR|nr:unnamed protein product [Chondrus crispus]CDF33552.1 unnamed protein product [Chondrus crispus]|eukprot:XP_005713355.1 unnamed protein product [Chondrus crispus]